MAIRTQILRSVVPALALALAGSLTLAACSGSPTASEPAPSSPAAVPSSSAAGGQEELVDGLAGPLKPYTGEGKVGFAI